MLKNEVEELKWDIMFKYFINDSIEHIIHKFYYEPDGDEAAIAHRRFNESLSAER